LEGVKRNKQANAAFQNLVVGRIAERVFRDGHLAQLETEGFIVYDYHEQGENRDYGVEKGGLELPINVKTASSLYREAKAHVTLDPEDCIPIGSYKALGAAQRQPNLVYVDLVDFTMRARVDAFMHRVEGGLAVLWDLLSWYGGSGARQAQDHYVDELFRRHERALLALAPAATSFRVISAQRVLAVLRDDPRRVPGLGIKAAGRGGFNAEANVHVSVSRETVPWEEVAEILRRDGIQPLLDRIHHKESRTLAAPTL
jgi:hypothetical protein